MISTSSLYQTENAKLPRKPVYRAKFYADFKKEILEDAPVGFWRFDDTNSTALDLSTSGLNGSYSGGYTQSQTGPFVFDITKAASFNGSTGYMSVADNTLLDPGDTFSLQGWVKCTDFSGSPVIIDKGVGGYILQLTGGGALALVKNGTGSIVISVASIKIGEWAHVAATKDGSDVHLYINGVNVTGVVTNQTIVATATAFNVGRTAAGTNFFPGTIANVAIFATELSSVRVRAHYDAGMDLIFPLEYSTHPIHANYADEAMSDGPSAYWRLNEQVTSPVTTTAADYTGHGQTGTYQGSPTLGVSGALIGDSATAVQFNGSSQYISVPDNDFLDPGDVFSIVMWVYVTAYPASKAVLIAKGSGGYCLYITSVGQLKFSAGNAAATVLRSSTTTIPLNTWTQVALTKNGARLAMYMNAVSVGGSGINVTIAATANDLHIATDSSTPGSYFTGIMDEVALYPVELSAARISAQYDTGKLNFYRHGVVDYMFLDSKKKSPSIGASQVFPERGQSSIGPLAFTLQDQADYDSEVMADNPAMYLALDELKGFAAYDKSGNNLSGQYIGAPQNGQVGPIAYGPDWATLLDGSTQYVLVPNDSSMSAGNSDKFSLEIIVKLTSTAGQQRLFSKGTGEWGFYLNNGLLVLEKEGTGIVVLSNSGVTAGSYFHIVVTKNGSDVHQYVNAVDVTGLVANQTFIGNSNDLYIGRKQSGGSFVNGIIARAAIYPNAVLSSTRVSAHYNAMLARPANSFNGSITRLVSPDIDGKFCVFSMGFDGITEGNYAGYTGGITSPFRGVVDCVKFAGIGSYAFQVSDPQAIANKQVFIPEVSLLLAALGSGDTSMNVVDNNGFLSSGYVVIDSEIISYSAKSARQVGPGDPPCNSVDYGNGVFIAVTNTSGTASRSSDGLFWSSVRIPDASLYTRILFVPSLGASGRWVIVGTNFCATSDDDGDSWTAQTIPAGTYLDVCYASGLSMLVAVGSSGVVSTSSNGGTTWVSQTSGNSRTWTGIVWTTISGGLLVACSSSSSPDSTHNIMTSANATAWTLRVTPTIFAEHIAYDGSSALVAMGTNSGSNVIISTDGVSWTAKTISGWVGGLGGMFYDTRESLFLIEDGNRPRIYTSSDGGSTWSTVTQPNVVALGFASDGSSITIGVGQAASSSGLTAMYSADDATWNSVVSQLTGLTRGVLGSTAAAHTANTPVKEMIRVGPAHPIDVFIDRLQSTDKTGLGMPLALIDTTKLAALKISIGSSAQMEWRITGSVNLKTWLEQEIFEPLALYPVISAGQFSARMIQPLTSSVDSITEDVTIDSGGPQLNWDCNWKNSICNQRQISWDYDVASDSFFTTQTFQDDASVIEYGAIPLPPISAHGFRTELPGTIDLITNAIQTRLIGRYKDGVPLVDISPFLQKNVLESGDVAAVTSRYLPNHDTGTRGITLELMEIIQRDMNLDSGDVAFQVLWPV